MAHFKGSAQVNVSVNPDVIIKRDVGGVIQIGALKLHISKGNALSEEGLNIVAVMLHKYVSDNVIKTGQVANSKLCIAFDVFNESLQCCPTAIKLRMRRIEAACEEIALWWSKV